MLVGRKLRNADADTARAAVAGYGIALDLTLRDLQNDLKRKATLGNRQSLRWRLPAVAVPATRGAARTASDRAGAAGQRRAVRQQGNTRQMMVGIFELMAHISTHFTLQPGDVVGTDRHAIRRWPARLRRRVDAQPGRSRFQRASGLSHLRT